MQTFVIDTSVAVKWFSGDRELRVNQAEELLKKHAAGAIKIILPEFLFLEFANVFLTAKNWNWKNINSAISKLIKLNIVIARTDLEIVTLASKLAAKYGLSVYDSVYLATAEKAGGVVVSDNVKHHGKIKDGSVIMLADLDFNT